MAAYDIIAALHSMEEELILSMKRNLQRHLQEEADEGFEWTQWQAEKLNSIAGYRAKNADIIGAYTSTIPDQIDEMIQASYASGKNQEEIRILQALKKGYAASVETAGEIGTDFFAVNERKMNALIAAVQGEMRKATSSILRYQEDIYRQTIFRAAAQYNMGGKTLWQAVDAATSDFLAAGICNIRYKDGRQVNIASYAEMALRTANLRANIQGEAAKRDEWGICTVQMSSHGSACPNCIPWQGKVYYDDVFCSVKVPKDGRYLLLSTAIDGGALHPNCKNGVSTWFEGINEMPKEMTPEEIEEANRRYDLEQKQRYCERNVRKYKRLSMGSLDLENAAKYTAKEKEWRSRLRKLVKDNPDVLRMDYKRLKLYDINIAAEKESINYMARFTPRYSDYKTFTSGTVKMQVKKVSNSKFDMYTDISATRKDKAVRFVEKEMMDIQEHLPRRFQLPKIAVVDFEKHSLNPYAIGGYDKATGIMYMNSKYDTKEKVLDFVNQYQRQFANTTEYAPILHELGHKFYEDCIKKLAISEGLRYNDSKKKMDRRIFEYIEKQRDPEFLMRFVSGYASDGESSGKFTEIVAECFSVKEKNAIADAILALLE